MDYKVVWSNRAIADLKEICDYIAARDAHAALRIGKGIQEHVNVLDTFPFIGPLYPRRTRGPFREIVFQKYRIFYYVSERDRRVEILHLRHGARDEPII